MQTLPPGEYYIGDPCYAIPDDEWDAFLDAWDEQLGRTNDGDGRSSGIFEFKGLKVFAGFTAHGDGTFDSYPVDSGTFGAVPVALVGDRERKDIENMGLGTFNVYDEEFETDEDEGTFYIGDETIQTDTCFDDYDYDDDR
jgi:hypothetical protein